MKILPKLFDSETKKKDDTFSFTISPIQTIVDSSVKPSDSLVGGARKKCLKNKRTVKPKLRNKFSDYDYDDDEFLGGADSFATVQLKKDVSNLNNKRTANEIILGRLYYSSESTGDNETTINIDSDSDKVEDNKVENKIADVNNQESTATEALVNKLEKVAVDTPKIEEPKETTESNTVQKLNDQVEQLQQKGGVIGVPDFFDDEETEEEDEDFNQSGGDFNTFISSLYNKKVGGKKRQYSEKATEFNRKTTEIIKSVYPNINPEELRAVRSEIYQTIRNKYDPEVFKTLKDYEKSELLLKATTPEVVKKIDIKEAVENKRKRIEEYFGKKNEETPSTPEDDVKETKKAKKTKKEKTSSNSEDIKETKKAKKTKKTKRGGGVDEETIELPYVLDGGCSCMNGGCDFF